MNIVNYIYILHSDIRAFVILAFLHGLCDYNDFLCTLWDNLNGF